MGFVGSINIGATLRRKRNSFEIEKIGWDEKTSKGPTKRIIEIERKTIKNRRKPIKGTVIRIGGSSGR